LYKLEETFKEVYRINRIIIDPCFTRNSENKDNWEKEIVDIKVYDFMGNFITQTKENNINLSEFKAGLYIIKVLIKDNFHTFKLQKS